MANSFYDEVEFNGFQNCKFISRANELGSIRILNLVICVDHFALLWTFINTIYWLKLKISALYFNLFVKFY